MGTLFGEETNQSPQKNKQNTRQAISALVKQPAALLEGYLGNTNAIRI